MRHYSFTLIILSSCLCATGVYAVATTPIRKLADDEIAIGGKAVKISCTSFTLEEKIHTDLMAELEKAKADLSDEMVFVIDKAKQAENVSFKGTERYNDALQEGINTLHDKTFSLAEEARKLAEEEVILERDLFGASPSLCGNGVCQGIDADDLPPPRKLNFWQKMLAARRLAEIKDKLKRMREEMRSSNDMIVDMENHQDANSDKVREIQAALLVKHKTQEVSDLEMRIMNIHAYKAKASEYCSRKHFPDIKWPAMPLPFQGLEPKYMPGPIREVQPCFPFRLNKLQGGPC